ncbi:MAG: DUF6517 family protein [Halobacteriales archaeon]
MRRILSGRAALVLTLAVTAGCSGLAGLAGGGDLTFSAAPVGVADEAAAASGFRVASDESFRFERTVQVAGESRTVAVEADMVHLRRPSDGGPAARVVVVAVPDIEILGQQLELARRVGPLSLVGRATASVGGIQRDRKVGERSVAVLGENRTVEVYRGTARLDGRESPVRVYTASFAHEGDTIVAVGLAPRGGEDGWAAVRRVIEGIVRA